MANADDENLNRLLTLEFSEYYAAMDLDVLRTKCAEMELQFEEEDIRRIEVATRNQYLSPWWFKFRTGRITASMFKSVCSTSIDNPSKTIVMEICYPELEPYESDAMKYGKEHKEPAFIQYKNKMEQEHEQHENYVLEKRGLYFNKDYPGFAASPNGISSCECHGKVLLHIKCPSSNSIENALNQKDPYIKKITNNEKEEEYVMVKTHSSYYQVQMLIFMTESKAADFVVWTQSKFIVIHVERNEDFWKTNFKKANKFLRSIILPEILGKKIIQEN